MAAVKQFRAKTIHLNSQQLHPNGRWTSDMRLKRLQTAAMVVMVIFYPNKLLYYLQITINWAKLDLGATAPPHDGNHSTCGYLGVIWTL